jgi:uncharacterized protein (TIGR03435 family)
VTLRELTELANGSPPPLRRVRIAGGPSWLDDLRFDVIAKGRDGAALPELLIGLQALLAERFQLMTHPDSRDLPVYALVTTGDATAAGARPGFARSSTDCSAPNPSSRTPAPLDSATPPPCVLMHTPGRIVGAGITVAAFIANGLSRVADDRVIIDRTQLAGTFDVHLEWTPDLKELRQPAPAGITAPFAAVGPPDGPSFFTALQEQAGLKLQPSTGAVDVIVIDRAERPPIEP